MQARIRSILKPMAGMVKFEIPRQNTLVVTYDNEKTTLAKIVQALSKGGLPPAGEPVLLN